MNKTNFMLEIEERHGKPIQEVLSDAYSRHGNLDDAAKAIGIGKGTIVKWVHRFGGQYNNTYRLQFPEPQRD